MPEKELNIMLRTMRHILGSFDGDATEDCWRKFKVGKNNLKEIFDTCGYPEDVFEGVIKLTQKLVWNLPFGEWEVENDKPVNEYIEIEEEKEENSFIPTQVLMARNMLEVQLLASIKTILSMKYGCTFSANDAVWNNYLLYTKNALMSTYLALMNDEWKDHFITSPKVFFADHLKKIK